MIVIRNRTKGLVVGETQKSFKIRALSKKETWVSKQQCTIETDYYFAQLAMHLWAGYQAWHDSPKDNIDGIAKISAFVPALILADRKLDAQLQLGSRVWDKVFCYDVAQAAGAWLAENQKATVADFTAKLEELIA